MSKTETAPKVRRKPARHSTIIMAGIDERILMIEATQDVDGRNAHVKRISELLDELRRSINGKPEKDSADD